ncbi:Rhodanese-like domain-containing protein [Mycena floridula]|nr:Rhodanese-like domain-containing protein [Mycena floridula]
MFAASRFRIFRFTAISRPFSVSATNTPLVLSPKQLATALKKNEPLTILDASWFMPNSPRNAWSEYLSKPRIPGAQYLDLDQVASPNELGLKHMMPSEELFSSACEKFGISPDSAVVIYDSQGVFSAPRALFMFRSFGHRHSSILNGGLPAWSNSGLPLESGPPVVPQQSTYRVVKLDSTAIRNYEQMVDNSSNDAGELVLDARSNGRYTGKDPEPRPGLSSGHIPRSVSLPFTDFLESNKALDGSSYTSLKENEALRDALVSAVGRDRAESILKGHTSVVTTCGSGMTAGVLWLGLKQISANLNIGLYDESWTGYALRPSSIIVSDSTA